MCDDIAVSLKSSGAAEELKPREKRKKPITGTVLLLMLENLLFASTANLR